MTRRRERASLAPPPASPAALARFPRTRLAASTELWRVTRGERDPWWFGSSGAGRFDLPEPNGTCYLAADPLAALLEVIGPDREGGAVSERFVADRRLRALRPPRDLELADLTSRRAAGFGVTPEISTVVPYELPQAWAGALFAAGSGGLRFWLRHDPARSLGYALFGPRGERRSWPRGRSQPIGDDLLGRLADECGLEVLPLPRLDELDIVG